MNIYIFMYYQNYAAGTYVVRAHSEERAKELIIEREKQYHEESNKRYGRAWEFTPPDFPPLESYLNGWYLEHMDVLAPVEYQQEGIMAYNYHSG